MATATIISIDHRTYTTAIYNFIYIYIKVYIDMGIFHMSVFRIYMYFVYV